MAAYIKTKDSIVLHFRGTQKIVSLTSPIMPKLLELLGKDASDEDLLTLVDVGYKVKNHSSGLFGILDGQVYVLGEVLPTSLGTRVLDFADNNLPVKPLLLFWENCKKNPDPRAKSDLYTFLETHGHPITSDGCFIGYRSVKKEHVLDENGNETEHLTGRLVDWHTGKHDNTPGEKPSMPREQCDSNPDSHCSHGYHVAKMSYALTFNSGTQDRVIIEVKVNPEHVVAIPRDCNGEKMRVCAFESLAINDALIDRHLYDQTMESDEDDGDEDFDAPEVDHDYEERDDTQFLESDFAPEVEAPTTTGLDFSKPQDLSQVSAAMKLDTRDNHKTLLRDSKGHFLPRK